MRTAWRTTGVLLLAASALGAQGHDHHRGDTTFRGVQARGAAVMGVDQATSTHRFDLLPDGGRIRLERDSADAAGTAAIRAHLRGIADAFARGDFSSPAMVHDRTVPGTAVMAARKAHIRYAVHDLPRGGEVRITTRDPAALRAIGEFIRFQRADHHAGGSDTTTAGMHDMHGMHQGHDMSRMPAMDSLHRMDSAMHRQHHPPRKP